MFKIIIVHFTHNVFIAYTLSESSTPNIVGHRLWPKIFWIQPVPTSCKRLGNHTPYTGYGPTTPGRRGGATNLKRTEPGSNLHHHILSLR
jgi:hypothetical protein